MPKASIKPKVDQCHCLAMRKATRKITQFYDDKLASTGLRTTQFSILRLIDAAGEASVNMLAEQLDLDRTTTGKNLRPLERAGFVQVVASPADGRYRAIRLTDQGAEVLRAATPLWRAAQRAFERSNNRDRIADLRSMIAALVFGQRHA